MTNENPGQDSANANSGQNRMSTVAALVIIGLGIGWLAGLSVSPVVSTK